MKILLSAVIGSWMILVLPSGSPGSSFDFNTQGKRVCLTDATVDLSLPSVTVRLLDGDQNTSASTDIYRRPLFGSGSDWHLCVSGLPSGTTRWVDLRVKQGEVWEYQVRRKGTWQYDGRSYDATGYAVGALLKDNTGYKGRMILMVADNIRSRLPEKYHRLKKDLTGDGWFVRELAVPGAKGWGSSADVVAVKRRIQNIYHNAPAGDKPRLLFILGHVPVPRSGSSVVTAADGHDENKGARGCDGYYADVDGTYTDIKTFNPGGLQTGLAVNRPNDFKWDQDFFPSDIEMGFGRVDFADIKDYPLSEVEMTAVYLDKLHRYRHVAHGFDMGRKVAFHSGYDNSNDASFRNLFAIAGAENVVENTSDLPHPLWVKNNGPFMIYMQNKGMPKLDQWRDYGMAAAVFSSDQSYWGFNDVPQVSKLFSKLTSLVLPKTKQYWKYSRIRSLLASDTHCLVILWTTTGNTAFFQSCTGEPMGLALKESMNHNAANKRIEKPPQKWDNEAYWYRTHFGYNGDPSLRLYQVCPPTAVSVAVLNGKAVISWKASFDAAVLGYRIYKSTEELGRYHRLTGSLLRQTTFTDTRHRQGDWYMVQAVSIETSGCGKFLNPSVGVLVSATGL